MKIILILLLLCVAALPITAKRKTVKEDIEKDDPLSNKYFKTSGFINSTNDFTDKLIANINQVMIQAGFDPLALQDISKVISRRVLLITYWGSLNLTNVKLSDLSTLKRYDDTVTTYDESKRILKIDFPLQFEVLTYECNYEAQIMGMGPSGKVDGEIKGIKIRASLAINLNIFHAQIANYKITDSGEFTMHFQQNMAVNWLLNMMSDTTTSILRPHITDMVDKIIESGMQAIADVINALIADIIEHFPEDEKTLPNLLNFVKDIDLDKVRYNKTVILNVFYNKNL